MTWDKDRALERIRTHAIGPLDLEVELQEEIVVTDYELGPAAPNRPRRAAGVPAARRRARARRRGLDGPDGAELPRVSSRLRKGKKKPPLYGLVHYEMAASCSSR